MDTELIFDLIKAADGVSAYTLTRAYCARTHDNIDWHKVSNYLDGLYTRGILRVVGFDKDGMTIYKLSGIS